MGLEVGDEKLLVLLASLIRPTVRDAVGDTHLLLLEGGEYLANVRVIVKCQEELAFKGQQEVGQPLELLKLVLVCLDYIVVRRVDKEERGRAVVPGHAVEGIQAFDVDLR